MLGSTSLLAWCSKEPSQLIVNEVDIKLSRIKVEAQPVSKLLVFLVGVGEGPKFLPVTPWSSAVFWRACASSGYANRSRSAFADHSFLYNYGVIPLISEVVLIVEDVTRHDDMA